MVVKIQCCNGMIVPYLPIINRQSSIFNPITPLTAHLLCLGCVAADLVARSFRIQWFLRGLGHPIRFRQACTINVFGEAGCTLTPMRVAGEPARLAGMLQAGVPATAAFVAIAVEVLAAWPVILFFAALLGWWFAPDWLVSAWPVLRSSVQSASGWVVAVLLATLLVGWLAARSIRTASHRVRRPLRRLAVYWRRMPRWPILASIPCTVINLISRTAILPLLALTLPNPPPLGALILGSFGLLYSQLIIPTPAGLGAVDLGLLGGAAGELGDANTRVLLAWRFYTVGVGAMIGVGLALRIFGQAALKRLSILAFPEAGK